MDLTHRFTLATSVDNAWATFNRLERLEPCFPGATVTAIDGDDFAGLMKIKMGPFGLAFEGSGSFTKRDEKHHKLVIEAKGKDARGYSDGTVVVTANFTGDDDHCDVQVHSDLQLSGRPASLGAGVIEEVSQRLMEQFVSCLSARFAGGLDSTSDEEFVPTLGSGGGAAPTVTTVEAKPRRAQEAERFDTASVGLAPVLKRAVPVLGGLGALVVFVAVIRRLNRS